MKKNHDILKIIALENQFSLDEITKVFDRVDSYDVLFEVIDLSLKHKVSLFDAIELWITFDEIILL